jgi:two-component sensor histidine kinase
MPLILQTACDALLAVLFLALALALWGLSRRLNRPTRRQAIFALIGFCALAAAAQFAQVIANWHGIPTVVASLKAATAFAGAGAVLLFWMTFLRQRSPDGFKAVPSHAAPTNGGRREQTLDPPGESASRIPQGVPGNPTDERTAELIAANERLEREIRDRKQVQDNLYRAIEEREALLREVHHRVKNNLQLVTSLLNMQIRGEESEYLRQRLREAQTRINVLSVVHNKMYAGEDLASVNLATLLPDLCEQIARMQNVDPTRIRLETDAEPIRTDMDHAIPMALLTTEAVTNALKHAFPNGRPGVVRVSLVENGTFVLLRIADNGVGFTPDVDDKPGALGSTLIRGMARQLDGTLDVRSEEGVEVVVTMPRDGLVVKPGLRKTA